ncbi:HAD-superfamily subfamily IB hydrolase, TIGR01490 [Psychromonas ingrahamii 37]|uniref:HAD-superfamily subfamily IB hydrolase, TIGR01490 n=1 Tax=Psychromonas ingrahamii (strain DSM 17664 / CCUG 51855 / 37) TaxID=357804 RepID=A1SZD4_PSYIN|nr:HAD family hydrolase [Psychromonas ingrahamii]ABM04849.1 HAD-superfamily subfamily IB hydrolase, TIGR01490 [Psychromonas ingrahamii 37]
MALAIFDLDETLVCGDSCSLFCQFMQAEGLVGPEFVERDKRMMGLYNAEKLVLDDYIEFFIEPLSHLSITAIDGIMPRFVEQYIAPRIYAEAQQVLKSQAAQGKRLLIISATAEFIVSAVARYLGVADVLAIRLSSKEGYYTGKIEGVPTFRQGKVTRLHNWLIEQNENLIDAQFYSDSINDLPLLALVDYPIATNPDTQLTQIAAQRHWPVLNWSAFNPLIAQTSISAPQPNKLFNEQSVRHFTPKEITHV